MSVCVSGKEKVSFSASLYRVFVFHIPVEKGYVDNLAVHLQMFGKIKAEGKIN